MDRPESQTQISAGRLRVGLVLFVVWWLPVYLTVPAIAAALGDGGNAHDVKVITASVLILQSTIGLIALLLLGKQLAQTIKRVSLKKLPTVVWKVAWTGNPAIDPSDLKPSKANGRG